MLHELYELFGPRVFAASSSVTLNFIKAIAYSRLRPSGINAEGVPAQPAEQAIAYSLGWSEAEPQDTGQENVKPAGAGDSVLVPDLAEPYDHATAVARLQRARPP